MTFNKYYSINIYFTPQNNNQRKNIEWLLFIKNMSYFNQYAKKRNQYY